MRLIMFPAHEAGRHIAGGGDDNIEQGDDGLLDLNQLFLVLIRDGCLMVLLLHGCNLRAKHEQFRRRCGLRQ